MIVVSSYTELNQNNNKERISIIYPHNCPLRISDSPPYHSWQEPGLYAAYIQYIYILCDLFSYFYLRWQIIIGCAHAFGEHNHCSLTYIFIFIYFPTPKHPSIFGLHRKRRCKKSFVSLAIELLVFLFTFRCTVKAEHKFLWQKVPCVNKGYSVPTSQHVSNGTWIQRA